MYGTEERPEMTQMATKPSGPAAAAVVAAGIGSLVLGILTTVNELSAEVHDFLDFSTNFGLGAGVGPLSGKVTLAVIAYVLSWGFLAYLWRGREIAFVKAFIWTLVLVGLGFALTFPPIFLFFAAE
jgi:hypothetical protein